MRIAAVLCAAVLTACATAANGAPVSAPTQPNPTITLNPVSTTMPPTTLPQTTTSTTTTVAPVLVPPGTPCEEWADEAVAGGWPNDPQILTKVLNIAWRESRCLPIGPASAYPTHYPTDYSKHFNGHDYGVMQVNRPAHEAYVVSLYGTFEKIVDPVTNFNFAWRLYSEREARGQCGWKPWSKPCN